MSTSKKKSAAPRSRPRRFADLGFAVKDRSVFARIGAEVRRIRTERGISMSEVARMAGVSLQLISDCEHGNRRFTGATLDAVVGALGEDVDALDIVLFAGACRRCCGSGIDPRSRSRESARIVRR